MRDRAQKKGDPTQAEIAEACRQIQAGWSDATERARRRDHDDPNGTWLPPSVQPVEGDEVTVVRD